MEIFGWTFSTRLFRFSLFVGVLIPLLFIYTLHVPNREDGYKTCVRGLNTTLTDHLPSSVLENEATVTSLPIILLWTGFFSTTVNWIPSPKSLGCSLDCYITSKRRFLKRSAAVVFHLKNLNIQDLPHWSANNFQKWVFFNKEAPPNTPRNLVKALEGKIHWTATYRRDSDFYRPYGTVVAKNETENLTDFSVTEKKPYLVCWIVSHCYTSSQRESYVHALRQYVTVTIYGSCGTIPCPNNDAEHCYNHISKSCKFYLSCENSICPDYVTEKLFYALKTDMVPIVMGGDNYSFTLPEHSYINVMDFPNPTALADYLLELDNDPSKFKAYHMWKTKYKVIDSDLSWVCDFCQKLHNTSCTSVRPYKDLVSWWFGDHKCPTWTEIIKDNGIQI